MTQLMAFSSSNKITTAEQDIYNPPKPSFDKEGFFVYIVELQKSQKKPSSMRKAL